MDPNEVLEEIRDAISALRDGGEDPYEMADRIAAHFEELDDYLCKGKILPEDWSGAHPEEE
jgi:hypothetical protein